MDIAMHRIEASKQNPGECQLTERLRSRCLLAGSRMLDYAAEAYLLQPLFGGNTAAYERWIREEPQSYISQVWRAGSCSDGQPCRGTSSVVCLLRIHGFAISLFSSQGDIFCSCLIHLGQVCWSQSCRSCKMQLTGFHLLSSILLL